MSNWKVLSGRISFLANAPTPPTGASVLDIYQRAWHSQPQNFQQAPNPLMPSNAQGLVGGMSATCSTLPNRVDFTLGPDSSQTPNLQLGQIENAGVFRSELVKIAEAVSAGSLSVLDAYGRVAVFVQFVAIGQSTLDSNKSIVQAIPEQYRIDLTDEESFLLQLSKPVSVSRVDKIKLNVVTKWSVEQFHIVSFGMSMGGPPGTPQPGGVFSPQVQTYNGASLTFDCVTNNTAKEQLNHNEKGLMLDGAILLTEKLEKEYGLDIEGYSRDHIAAP